jgi:hypothetical protein
VKNENGIVSSYSCIDLYTTVKNEDDSFFLSTKPLVFSMLLFHANKPILASSFQMAVTQHQHGEEGWSTVALLGGGWRGESGMEEGGVTLLGPLTMLFKAEAHEREPLVKGDPRRGRPQPDCLGKDLDETEWF